MGQIYKHVVRKFVLVLDVYTTYTASKYTLYKAKLKKVILLENNPFVSKYLS